MGEDYLINVKKAALSSKNGLTFSIVMRVHMCSQPARPIRGRAEFQYFLSHMKETL